MRTAPSSRRRGAGRTSAALALCSILTLLVGASGVRPAAAYPTSNVTVAGHGWGHGQGMGQWGAFGYAVDKFTFRQILTHYYGQLAAGGATTTGTLSSTADHRLLRVAITENDGNDTIVTSRSAFTVNGVAFAAGRAALLQPTDGTNTHWRVLQGPGCAGPWSSTSLTSVVDPIAAPVSPAPFPAGASLSNETLQLCLGSGNTFVRGDLQALANSSGELRTVNIVPLEQYVADVTTAESPAYWGAIGGAGPQGQAWGFQELEAQAVAVRSYALSDLGGWGGYADTCDQSCQTYVGIGHETTLGTAATQGTTGVAVLMPDGAVAATQYSASTGGYTVAATFAAVPDAGDSVCLPQACNPNHSWTATIPVSAVESFFSGIGTLQSVRVTSRDGHGEWGGRVLGMTIIGSKSSVTLSGYDFASDFAGYGMLNYWFNVTSEPSGGMGGYWLEGAAGGVTAFGDAPSLPSMVHRRLNAPMVAMAAMPDHKGYWELGGDGGIFSFGDARFWGSTGSRKLNAPVVGMSRTVDGAGYWLVATDGGVFSFGDAHFWGSTGSIKLNKPVVNMAGTPDRRGYWLVASDGGVFSFGDAHFWGSTGSIKLSKPVVGMATTGDGRGYWLVAADGGVFSFGDARYQGSLPGMGIHDTAVAILPTYSGNGYVIVCADGRAYSIGDAPQFGDLQSIDPGWAGRMVGAASVPS